ncbi:MAG: DmsC/YnfH family molybdoenzyme membrane anchor subunit [Dongiaceae bacterium]
MNPPYSVIVFTTAAGAGYGLLFWLALAVVAHAVPIEPVLGATGVLLAMVLVTTGLLLSSLHLGRPERAWRALSQYRTSWLAREGIAAIATYIPAVALAAIWVFAPEQRICMLVAAVLSGIGASVTVWCTGMIYATLPTIPAWNQRLTAPIYLVIAGGSGAVLLNLILSATGLWQPLAVWIVLLLMISAFGLKLGYWKVIDMRSHRVTLAEAIGLTGYGPVRPLIPPHTQANFVMREMGYAIARKHRSHLRWLVILFIVAVPMTSAVLQLTTGGVATRLVLAASAALSVTLGVLIERWLFFAEAEHISIIYYSGQQSRKGTSGLASK